MQKSDDSPLNRSLTSPRIGDDDSQSARAFVRIRDLLLRGEFSRGERISELPLGARLGMSRTPIRMALERLAHVGLVDVGPTGGFLVPDFTLAEVRDAIELRGVLEGTAARLAAERLTNESELDSLHHWLEQVDSHAELSTSSFASYLDGNESFHWAIVDLAKSDMLQRLLQQTSSLPFASPSAMVYPTSMLSASSKTLMVAQEQHRSLFDAILHKEGTRAEHLAREHARLAWKVLQMALEDRDVLDQVPGGALIDLPAR
jgi:GntR family transcriptional regulator, vanillate catabolism transcriptional regulator